MYEIITLAVNADITVVRTANKRCCYFYCIVFCGSMSNTRSMPCLMLIYRVNILTSSERKQAWATV